MADVTTIETWVYDRLGVPATDPQFPAATVIRFINQANHFIEVDEDWPWGQTSTTFNTADGTDTYSPPANWRKTRRLRVTVGSDKIPLERRPIDEIDDWGVQSGQPEVYAIEGDQIVVWPTPDGVYAVTHRYQKVEAELAAGGDTPGMPAAFHAAIAEVAAWMCLRRSREDPRAVAAWAAWAGPGGWRSKMLDDLGRHAGPAKVRTRVRL